MSFLLRTRVSLPNWQPHPSSTDHVVSRLINNASLVDVTHQHEETVISHEQKNRTTKGKQQEHQKNTVNTEIDQRRAVACRLAVRNRSSFPGILRIQSLDQLLHPVRAGINGGSAAPCPKKECTLGFWYRVVIDTHGI